MIENKNANAAAKNVSYTITLYGADQSLIQEVSGVLDLPPGTSVPVFVPGISSGKQMIARAFLEIVSSSLRWFSLSPNSRMVPTVSNTKHGGTMISAPRIEAILTNQSVTILTNVKVIVLVRNNNGDIIAVSSTIVPTIQAQSQATATFTWNEAFSSVPASIEVVPIISLP